MEWDRELQDLESHIQKLTSEKQKKMRKARKWEELIEVEKGKLVGLQTILE